MAQQTELFTSSYFQLEEVAEGVFAALVFEGTGALGNAGFVDLGDEVLVFDTFMSPQPAEDLRRAVEVVVGKPIRYVVNSHYHQDHCMGNQVFEGATFLSTPRTRELILERNSIGDPEEEQKGFGEYLKKAEHKALLETDEVRRKCLLVEVSDLKVLWEAIPMIRLTPPTVLFDEHLTIQGSKRRVELITYGGGHTDSDSFLYIPELQLAFMADLVLVEATPFMGVGHPEQWLTILDRVKELDVKTIIPGHGQIGTAEHIDQTANYLRFVLETISTAKADGLSVDEVAKRELPAPYKDWESPIVFEWNVRRLWDRE